MNLIELNLVIYFLSRSALLDFEETQYEDGEDYDADGEYGPLMSSMDSLRRDSDLLFQR